MKTYLALLFGILYVISPLDLLPDILGPLGRVDDIGVAGFVMWLLWRFARQAKKGRAGKEEFRRERRAGNEDHSFHDGEGSETAAGPASLDPFEILGVDSDAGRDAVVAAYRELLSKYHPDRVEHLGREFQEIAEERTKEINRAYGEIMKGFGGR